MTKLFLFRVKPLLLITFHLINELILKRNKVKEKNPESYSPPANSQSHFKESPVGYLARVTLGGVGSLQP